MRRYGSAVSINTLLVVIALILAILALAGFFSPLTLVEVAVVLLSLAMLI